MSVLPARHDDDDDDVYIYIYLIKHNCILPYGCGYGYKS